MYRVSFTGHRPNRLPFLSELEPECVKLKNRIEAAVREVIADGADLFNTGMALGVDMWAAEIVLGLKEEFPHIKLTALIPCPDQADRWGEELKARYNGILARCDKVITISPCYDTECMKKRNMALVDSCDVLIAVFDGSRGGTYQTVNYAKFRHKQMVILKP